MTGKRIPAAVLSAALAASLLPVQSFAQTSPEFAYSAEKWETLRDNRLEFDEIVDLVHEYNNTVIQNYITYRSELDEDADDVRQEYYDAASDIYNNIEYPDSDSSTYGSEMAAALQSKIQADELQKQGDESTDDTETKKIGYDQTEATLAKQAQTLMVTYWTQYYNLDSLQARKADAETSYQTELNKYSAGMSTRASVLSAQDSITTAAADIVSAESSLEQTRESLCIMLGWAYGADVEIGELPEPDMEWISSIDLAADIETAYETNYDHRISTKQLANARSTSGRDKLAQTVANQKAAISNSVKDYYESLVLALSDYELALQSLELEEINLAAAQAKLAAGTITQNSYATYENAYETARVSVITEKLALLQAEINYRWAVDGLASSS